jgi:hypothetical protein
MEVFSKWWGYREIAVHSEAAAAQEVGAATEVDSDRAGNALCYSGGADSFYSLLCGQEQIDSLIFVQGFDIPLCDTERAERFVPTLETVAREVGARPILIRTNLRDHTLSREVNWERSHGGALAAAGHLVADARRLIVAASFPSVYAYPWGSRWDIDPLWSSSATEIVHHGADRWRAEKLREIARFPIVRDHLRVCWENRSRDANCSSCEKCVRTMLTLAQDGALADFRVFDASVPLAARVSGLGRIDPVLVPVYSAFLEPEIDPDTSRAIRMLIDASTEQADRTTVDSIWRRFRRVLLR